MLERVPSHRLEQGSQYNVSHVPPFTVWNKGPSTMSSSLGTGTPSLSRQLHTPTFSFYNFKSLNGVWVVNRHSVRECCENQSWESIEASWNDASRSCAQVTDLIVFDKTELTPRAGLAELERVVKSYNPVGNGHSVRECCEIRVGRA